MIFFSEDSAPNIKKIPLRSEISEADKWNLTHLYPSDAAWEKDLEDFKKQFPKIKKFQGTLENSSENLLACLEFEKALDLKAERLGHYCSLRVTEDASDNASLDKEARFQNLMTRAAEVASFITPEIQEIDNAKFEAFLNSECLKSWVNKLKRLRRFKPHTLSQKEERLLALGSAAITGHDETFSQLTNVDMKFGVITDDKGRKIELSHGAFSSLLQKRDGKVRREAFLQYYKEFDDHKFTIASTLANSVRADVFFARARNFKSALEWKLFPDKVPVEVYNNLITTVRKNLPVLFRYYELRKRVLKLDEIHQYDTYVPLVEKIDKRTKFDKAIDIVLESLQQLGSEYVTTLECGLKKSRWCDRYESKGKRSGAFSSGSYKNPPYILMNYKEDVFGDVYTLAHEAGHSMHNCLSQENQSFQDYNYPIFLAEVASTFNEELVTHHLLKTTEDRDMRAYIICRQIDDIRGTVYRQTMFAEFEKLIHAMEENGEALTLDAFCAIYRKLLNDYFGKNFAIDKELDLECLRIPHFYSSFYVFKYATGLSAAVALSNRVLSGGKKELEDYLGFLKSGGTKYPIETLAAAGVDMSNPAPIEATLKLFANRVQELEELLLR